ncbi:4-hydroxy-2-oxovalerate aldolase [Ensifer sp. ENS05]|uniref:HpcH/HpaI aldolase family protein n=1 Tax=Ensifer sp. ENS05 TaxID=2769277 RepID=UPI001781088C|nr:aldolase/citrate lyase family protein [Ensifer sp. ENS05]MBD9597399.1 4-hydroxy-2-oxovalerate aldolase [Ensifer sp. ENS05]
MNGFRQKCLSGVSVRGSFISIPHPVAVEVVAQTRPDFLCIDWEHSQIGRERVEDLVRAASVHAVPAIVRVPGHAPEAISAALDSGAGGVLVPRISTVEQAKAAVSSARYPPLGSRGVGPGRAAGYGYRIPEYTADANSGLLLAVQIETAEALENLEGILSVDEIDVAFIGPGDLAVSMGCTRTEDADRVEAAIGKIIESARRKAKIVGCFSQTVSQAMSRRETGVTFSIIGSDASLLHAAAAGMIAAVQNDALSQPT